MEVETVSMRSNPRFQLYEVALFLCPEVKTTCVPGKYVSALVVIQQLITVTVKQASLSTFRTHGDLLFADLIQKIRLHQLQSH